MLLDSLKNKYVESFLPDGRFAQEVLGIDPSAWSQIKSEKRAITLGQCKKILAAFPDLRSEVVQYRYLQEGMDPDTLSEADAVAAS